MSKSLPDDNDYWPSTNAIKEQAAALATMLERAVAALKSQGWSPGDECEVALTEYRVAFFDLQTRVQSAAASEGEGVSPSDLSSIDGLEMYMARIRDASEQRRTAAQTVLDAVERLGHLRSEDVPLIEELRVTIRQVRECLATAHSETARSLACRLSDGSHGLAALLRLAHEYNELSSSEWRLLHQNVTDSLGLPLADLAARGRLTSGSTVPAEAGRGMKTSSAPLMLGSPPVLEPITSEPPVSAAVSSTTLTESLPVGVLPSAKPEPVAAMPTAVLSESAAHELAIVPASLEPLPEAFIAAPTPEATDPAVAVATPDADASGPVMHCFADAPQTKLPARAYSSFDLSVVDMVRRLGDVQNSAPYPDRAEAIAPVGGVPEPTRHRPSFSRSDGGVRGPLCPRLSRAGAPPAIGGTEAHLRESVDTTSRAMAAALINENKRRRADFTELTWRLIRDGHLDIAFHLADHVAAFWPGGVPYIPPSLIAANLIAASLRHSTGPLAETLHDVLDDPQTQKLDATSPWHTALQILLISSCLRPSLLAPGTNAPEMLSKALEHLPISLFETKQLCTQIAGFGLSRHTPLEPDVVRTAISAAQWQEELAKLQAELAAWLRQASTMKVLFQPATAVWQHWLRPGGILATMFEPVRSNQPERSKIVTDIITTLERPHRFLQLIWQTDRNELARQGGREIQARAITRLQSNRDEAVGLARRWLALHRRAPGPGDDGWMRQQADALRSALNDRSAMIAVELRQFIAADDKSLSRSAAGALLNVTIQDLRAVLDGTFDTAAFERPLQQVLHGVLLAEPDIVVTSDWKPRDSPGEVEPLLRLSAGGGAVGRVAFDNAVARQDHTTTRRIIEYLRGLSGKPSELASLETSRQKHLKKAQDEFRIHIRDIEAEIERTVVLGRVPEIERLQLVASIETLQLGLDEDSLENFQEAKAVLGSIRGQLERRCSEERRQIEEQLANNAIPRSHEAFSRILEALAANDFSTAWEYLEIVRSGARLPSTQEDTTFDEFRKVMPVWEKSGLYEIDKARESILAQIVSNLRKNLKYGQQRDPLFGRSLKNIDNKQLKTASDLITAWFSLKVPFSQSFERDMATDSTFARDQDRQLQAVFELMGFKIREMVVHRDCQPVQVSLMTEPVIDQVESLVPAFGSILGGRYRVMLYWNRPEADAILRDVREGATEAKIVLCFSRMSERTRKDLARACRERKRTVIVIDDIVLLFMCTVQGSRIKTLLSCTLPYTFSQPYSADAGTISPEMFYGRRDEKSEVVALKGSCFIYGGRQLGKTVLLKTIASEEHRPANGKIVLWIDLKAEHIGTRQPLDYLWHVVCELLRPYGVVPDEFRTAVTQPRAFLGHMEDWLLADVGRRILLLLDEADAFLERDGIRQSDRPEDAFLQSSLLKGAMDRTDGRFKVVFAGLHNVVRTTRESNHPLGHFGEPKCIGPLFDHGEVREARRLIESPFRVLGYRFQQQDLVWRILYRTNYYPSLIQLYCKHLLELLNQSERCLGQTDAPRYDITTADVEEVYRSQRLQEEIKRRFILTLELDPRYEVIAYAIALVTREEAGTSAPQEGFTLDALRELALSHWPDGFQNDDPERFGVLLDEMVGLGVLRSLGNRRYALRSPNVLLLLGSNEDVYANLARQREIPPKYLASTFRGPYPWSLAQIPLRSPLTLQQESELHRMDMQAARVVVIAGSEATGLGEIESRV